MTSTKWMLLAEIFSGSRIRENTTQHRHGLPMENKLLSIPFEMTAVISM